MSKLKNCRTLVLGLGNDILCDDAIGLKVVQRLSELMDESELLDFKQTTEMGLSLLDYIAGYEFLVIVDAMKSGKCPVGSVLDINEGEIEYSGLKSPHLLGVKETIEIGRKLGLKMPQEILILGIETEDPFTISESLSKALESRFEDIVNDVKCRILEFTRNTEERFK